MISTRTVRSLALAAALVVSAFGAPAFADTTASGDSLDVATTGFPDRVYLGASLEGTVAVTLHDDGTGRARRVRVSLVTESFLGRAEAMTWSLRLAPGETRTLSVRVSVPETTPTGLYRYGVEATTTAESVATDDAVYVVGGK